MESQVRRLDKFGLRKSVDLLNSDQESHVMRVTCIFICIILHTTHNVLHITPNILYIEHNILHVQHYIFHITHSYAMRLEIIDLTSRLPKNEGSAYGTSTREPSLEKQSMLHSFIRTSLHTFIRQCRNQLYLRYTLRLLSGSLCNDQEWCQYISLGHLLVIQS